MRFYFLLALLFASVSLVAQKTDSPPKTIAEITKDCESYEGYFNFHWHAESGKLYLEIDRWEEEFLYVNSLSSGVGSNDLGLDRNQLGQDRIVKFVRSGPKVLLLQPNYEYRAESDNVQERAAVAQAFAQSVLWGFKVAAVDGERVLVDLTPFLMQDAHGVVKRLKQNKQGTYKVDDSRSMVNLARCRAFPKNTEFDALITLAGQAEGAYIRSVTPTPDLVTVSMHHSFIELPDDGYEPRVFDPRCGYFPFSYYDYAMPIGEPLEKRLITRHRLQRKDPTAAVGEAVEPIIYYLDPGTPEPIRAALLEGASWWDQAFRAAGYRNAFQVKVLPRRRRSHGCSLQCH
jgi:hypothetical protein